MAFSTADANADLLNLMTCAKVPEEIQKKLYEAGVSSVKEFAALVTDEADMRKLLVKEFGIKEDDGLAERVKVSKVIVAWETAKGRTAKMTEMEGEAEVRGEPKKVPQPDYEAMKETFRTKRYELQDHTTPAKSVMEKRLDMIEKNSLTAEPLSEILAVDEDMGSMATTKIDSKGNLVAVKMSNTVPLPENPEQLRHRLCLWGRTWIMASYIHTNRAIFADLNDDVFDRYVEHMLGRFVMGLVVDGPVGTPATGDTWVAILEYDLEIRKEALRRVQKGLKLATAMKEAWQDVEVKMKYFMDPVLMGKRKRTDDDASYDNRKAKKEARTQSFHSEAKGKGKTKSKKGKGKGKSKGKTTACKSTTPDGNPICYAFNNPFEWCYGCNRAHVCGRCFKAGKPMYDCDHTGPGQASSSSS